MSLALFETIEDVHSRNALAQFFGAVSLPVVGRVGTETIYDPDLRACWERQLRVESFIRDLNLGNDEKAIETAAHFAGESARFVGILARMLETGRETLVPYLLSSIEEHPSAREGSHNGRSLLHHAASLSCLPVVEKLLHLGANPNQLDTGGHAALYRAAATKFDAMGASVVKRLVIAGADPNHQGGSSRSAALHQAARFGNLEVARALLEVGASRDLRDRKGLTPLDRARNCRRNEVVALLTPP